MRLIPVKTIHPLKPALLISTILALLPALSAAVSIKQINAPGPAVRMTNGGNLTGTYQVKCSKLGG